MGKLLSVSEYAAKTGQGQRQPAQADRTGSPARTEDWASVGHRRGHAAAARQAGKKQENTAAGEKSTKHSPRNNEAGAFQPRFPLIL